MGSGRFRPPGPAPLVSLAKAPVAAYFAHIMPVPYSPAWLYIGTMATGPRGDPGGALGQVAGAGGGNFPGASGGYQSLSFGPP